ncbi:hypothetical protein E4U55_007882 [Claviceps digitariae]|nr:hypothetical protein E4U55_007882 [Claviceps digitariae]
MTVIVRRDIAASESLGYLGDEESMEAGGALGNVLGKKRLKDKKKLKTKTRKAQASSSSGESLIEQLAAQVARIPRLEKELEELKADNAAKQRELDAWTAVGGSVYQQVEAFRKTTTNRASKEGVLDSLYDSEEEYSIDHLEVCEKWLNKITTNRASKKGVLDSLDDEEQYSIEHLEVCEEQLARPAASLTTYNEDARDMKEGRLFTRDWRIVGTKTPPSLARNASDTDSVVQHFNMYYQQKTDWDAKGLCVTEPRTTSGVMTLDLDLDPGTLKSIELMPLCKSALGRYYEYFSRYVAPKKGDQLISLCDTARKSPCFDIQDCWLVKPASREALRNFERVEVGGETCVPLVPRRAIDAIRDSLAVLGISVQPSMHDAFEFNGDRIRMVKNYTSRQKAHNKWKGNTYTPMFRRVIDCTAVAAATFTVSMVLGVVYGEHSHYNNRKTLSIVIHSIK